MSKEEYKDAIEVSVIFHEGQRQLTDLEKDAANLLFALHDAWPYVHGWCNVESRKQNIIHLMRKHGDFADLYKVRAAQQEPVAFVTPLMEQPAQQEPVTEAQIVAGARVLNRRMADMCGIDAEDQWKQYGEDFKADARAVLEAAHNIKEKHT